MYYMLTRRSQADRCNSVNPGQRETSVVIVIRSGAQTLHTCCNVCKYYKVYINLSF